MKNITVNTYEDLHHVCLMYGLKKAYTRFPFLADNIMATPPPFRVNPAKNNILTKLIRNHPVNVHYFKSEIKLIYDESRVTDVEIVAFAKTVTEEYLLLRHPYMKCIWEADRLSELSSGRVIAEIIRPLQETDDMP